MSIHWQVGQPRAACTMSSLVDDPGIPLIGMSKHHPKYTTPHPAPTTRLDRRNHFISVGARLARRKELYSKRKRVCDASVALAVVGIVIMMVETELAASGVISRADATSYVLKLLVTATTIGCLAVVVVYHALDVQLFTINNSMEVRSDPRARWWAGLGWICWADGLVDWWG